MECFEHSAMPAIGICKSCNKAICRTCAKSFPKGLACSDACLKDAIELVEMNERAKKLYGIGDYKTSKLASGVWVWILLSAVMWIVASLSYFFAKSMDVGSLAMAVVFSIIAVVVYRSSKSTGLKC